MLKVLRGSGDDQVVYYFRNVAEMLYDSHFHEIFDANPDRGWSWERYTSAEIYSWLLDHRKEAESVFQSDSEITEYMLKQFGMKILKAAMAGENNLLIVVDNGVRSEYVNAEPEPDFEDWACRAIVGLGLAARIENVSSPDPGEVWPVQDHFL